MKVVVDCAGGTSSLVLPSLLGRVGVDVLTVNNRLDDASPTETLAERRRDLQRLAELVGSSRAAFGVRFDPVGERVSLVDEMGQLISEERALLVVLDLVAAERRGGRVALPVTTTRVAEQVCRFHGVQAQWTSTAIDALTARPPKARDGLRGRRAGRLHRARVRPHGGRPGGVPAPARPGGPDPAVAQPDRRQDPRGQAAAPHGADPVGGQGRGDALGRRGRRAPPLDTTDGVRVVEEDGSWALVLPDPAEAVTHLWAEGFDVDSAQAHDRALGAGGGGGRRRLRGARPIPATRSG